MKHRSTVLGIMIGVVMAILWSIVFVNVLHSMAGIGIGICFGLSFSLSFRTIFPKKGTVESRQTGKKIPRMYNIRGIFLFLFQLKGVIHCRD